MEPFRDAGGRRARRRGPSAKLVTPAELASIRATVATFSGDRVQILRPASVADAGGTSTTYSVIATDVPARIAPSGYQAGEQVIGAALVGVAQWHIVLPAQTDVQRPDVIAQGAAFSGSGITEAQLRAAGARLWEVARIDAPRTIEVGRVVYAVEIG